MKLDRNAMQFKSTLNKFHNLHAVSFSNVCIPACGTCYMCIHSSKSFTCDMCKWHKCDSC